VNKRVGKLLGLLLAAAIVIGGAWFGYQYYLDNIKLPAVGPSEVISRYFEAVKKGDFKTAYAMVSRAHYPDSYNQFIDRASMYSPQMKLTITGESIDEKQQTAHVTLHVTVPLRYGLYASNTGMDLARVKREWKIMHP
jgi:hypothetical protein